MYIQSSQDDQTTISALPLIERFKSPFSTNIANQIRQASETDSCVIIIGETNTGKRWTAHCIHNTSTHRFGPFYKVACHTMSSDRINRELLGHLAYTPEGIVISHEVFRKADGGTLLIEL